MQRRYLARGARATYERRPRWLYRLVRTPRLPTVISIVMVILLVALLFIALTGTRV